MPQPTPSPAGEPSPEAERDPVRVSGSFWINLYGPDGELALQCSKVNADTHDEFAEKLRAWLAAHVAAKLAAAEELLRWRDVKTEPLPDGMFLALVPVEYGSQGVEGWDAQYAHVSRGHLFDSFGDCIGWDAEDVTHWMPMPALPLAPSPAAQQETR